MELNIVDTTSMTRKTVSTEHQKGTKIILDFKICRIIDIDIVVCTTTADHGEVRRPGALDKVLLCSML